ncbi:MAG: hypothetical protein ACI849_001144 [Patiriisocius sp.]|jgi:hypothetical protein
MRDYLLYFFLFTSVATAQDIQHNFPDDFFGNYTGILHIHNDKGTTELPMEFYLQPTDSVGSYQYTLVYGEGEQRQERLYTLKEKNKDKGEYIVDENNSIILDDKVIGNRMYALFEVGGSLLTTFITFEKDHMIFEIVYLDTSKKNITGGTSEEIPEVISYPILVVQRAVLKKQ